MDMINEQRKVLRTRLDKYPILEDAEVGHCFFFCFLFFCLIVRVATSAVREKVLKKERKERMGWMDSRDPF